MNSVHPVTIEDMSNLIDVPAGLNGVAVTDTSIGDVDGEAGFFHYRGHDATDLARHHSFEEVWHLVAVGHLPDDGELAAFRAEVARHRVLPASVVPVLGPLATATGPTLGRVPRRPVDRRRRVGSAASSSTSSRIERAAQALRVSTVMPTIVAALHRVSLGLDPLDGGDELSHAARTWALSPARRPAPTAARALEQYLILTIDHGFNASTFTARVVASTGADLADVVGAALGALAGPLHGGAPGRALDALDAIGPPCRTEGWVANELAAGRRIMGFGHPVYRAPDPRSTLLREIATRQDGELVDQAIEIERRILDYLRHVKPDRPLPSNVEFFAGVVMASAGLPRPVHPDVRRQPHHRLDDARPGAGRRRQADPAERTVCPERPGPSAVHTQPLTSGGCGCPRG